MTSICYRGKFAEIFLHDIHNRAIAVTDSHKSHALPMVPREFDEAK